MFRASRCLQFEHFTSAAASSSGERTAPGWCALEATETAVPHRLQNFAPASSAASQRAHAVLEGLGSGVPQRMQNLAVGSTASPQRVQSMVGDAIKTLVYSLAKVLCAAKQVRQLVLFSRPQPQAIRLL